MICPKIGRDTLVARSLKGLMMRMTCLLHDQEISGPFHVMASRPTRILLKLTGFVNRMRKSLEFRMKIFLLRSPVTWPRLLVDANQVKVRRTLLRIGLASLEA
jgi:hypothetical protein